MEMPNVEMPTAHSAGLDQLFSFNLSEPVWILFGLGVLFACLAITIGWHGPLIFSSTAVRPVEEDEEVDEETENPAPAMPSEDLPKTSVIVFAQAEEEGLECCLGQLMQQVHPDFEVIVVCDGTHESARILQEHFSTMFPGVYITFIPPGSHNLSRRKLAITIGVKAAKGEVILTTETNILIPSRTWLSDMSRPFKDPSVSLTLGPTRLDFSELKGLGRWYRQFDETLTDARWIGNAINGAAYRGDGFNLAFRRDVFFRHKGYAGSLYLHSGDDDLFVQEISTPRNTVAVTGLCNLITTYWYGAANRVWTLRKARYSFTSRWLRKGPFIRAGFASLCQWLVPGFGVAAALLALPSLAGVILALLLLIIFWGVEIAIYRKIALRLGAVRLFWALPLFLMARPIVNSIFRFDHRESNRKIFTWQR